MKRQTIGKIQLWIGIVLLIVSFLSGILAHDELFKGSNVLKEFEPIEAVSYVEEIVVNDFYATIMLIIVLFGIISILFITQGLANMSAEEKR